MIDNPVLKLIVVGKKKKKKSFVSCFEVGKTRWPPFAIIESCHLFLHTFDCQIFTVLSLAAVKMCLELVHMALMGLS